MKKKILICGSSKNLGKFLALNFEKNFNVIQISRSFKTNLKKNFFRCDLRKEKEVVHTLNKIKSNNDYLDAIVFCVGDSKKNYDKSENSISIKDSLNKNFFVFVNLLESFCKIFVKKKRIEIIVISSIASSGKIAAPVTYSLSKNLLNQYCEMKARELIKRNIFINIISPGNILMENNNWGKKLKKDKTKTMKYIKENVPSNKFCTANDIYSTCMLLLEGSKNFVGSNIILDGGQSL
jgi:short-subunit dehydrogenase